MANEWVQVDGAEETYRKRSYTVESNASASFGTLAQLLDSRKASEGILASQPSAGVWAEEKVESDTATRKSFFTGGIFEARIAGTVNIGDKLVAASSQNYVKQWNPFNAAGSFGLLVTASFNYLARALEAGVDSDTINVGLIEI